MKTLQQKLNDVETGLRRWHTRLTRASNMLQKLERQRRRLASQLAYITPAPGRAQPVPVQVQDPPPVVTEAIKQIEDAGLSIPPFLKRTQADADKMKADRLAKEAADKKKMPLSGKAAQAALRPKRKANA
jgi:hypothetical protein